MIDIANAICNAFHSSGFGGVGAMSSASDGAAQCVGGDTAQCVGDPAAAVKMPRKVRDAVIAVYPNAHIVRS